MDFAGASTPWTFCIHSMVNLDSKKPDPIEQAQL